MIEIKPADCSLKDITEKVTDMVWVRRDMDTMR